MAIRRPSWDMDIREIDRRAEQLKRVDAYFKAEQQQARADAATRSRTEQEVTSEVSRIMNSRADAQYQNGLKMVVHYDESNRPHRTFELAPGATKRDTWMAPYMAQPQLQIRICKDGHAPGSPEANAYQARWEATQAMIASGNITLPEL